MTNSSRLPPAVESILNIARWAPSGDNAQPWTFENQGDESIHLCIHHQPGNVYEYRGGEPTLISAGTLLENIKIAAQSFGKRATWKYLGCSANVDRVLIHLTDDPSIAPDELFEYIPHRSVDRRSYKLLPLTADQKRALELSVGDGTTIHWYEDFRARWKIANLCRQATDIRLRIPETFKIHNNIVDWDREQSPNAIPAKALGLDTFTLLLMRWTLANQARTNVANKLGSPFFAALQMDLIPGLLSGGYFTLNVHSRQSSADSDAEQLLNVGQSMQRFWLNATHLGLVMQPCVALLAFSHYGAAKEPFTVSSRQRTASEALAANAQRTFADHKNVVFVGRIGSPASPPKARSIRRSLSELICP